jgi:hypothetical protein
MQVISGMIHALMVRREPTEEDREMETLAVEMEAIEAECEAYDGGCR